MTCLLSLCRGWLIALTLTLASPAMAQGSEFDTGGPAPAAAVPRVEASAKAFPGVLKQWKDAAMKIQERMVKMGLGLLFALAMLQVVLGAGQAALKGHDASQVLIRTTQLLVMTTFYAALIILAPVLLPKVLDEWHRIGGVAAATGPLDPGGIFMMGLSVMDTVRSAIQAKAGGGWTDILRTFGLSIQIFIALIFIFACFLILAAQMAMIMLKAYMWCCVAPLLLGFGGLKSTRDIAMNTLKASIGIGASLLAIYVVAGLAAESVSGFNTLIADFTLENFMPLWTIVGVSFLLALAALQVPKLASDFVNGTISAGLGDAGGAAIAAAAGGAAMAPALGQALGGAANVAGAGIEQLGGVMKAAGSAMASASDHGKTGLDAVAHAAGEMAGGASRVFGGRFDIASTAVGDQVEGAVERFGHGVANSFGGQVAESIESNRGGTMSGVPGAARSAPAGSNPNVGTGGPASGGASSPDVGTRGSAAGSNGGTSPIGGNVALTPNADGSTPGQTTIDSSTRSQASIGADAAGAMSLEQKVDDMHRQLTQPKADPLHAQIKSLEGYIPPTNDQPVGVNANLGGPGADD